MKTKEAFMVIRSQTTHLSSKSLSGPSSEPEAHKASTVVLHDSKPYDMSYVTELQDVLNSGQKILKTEVTILSRFSTTDQSDSKNDGLISNTTTQIRNPGSFQELENNVASFSERKPTGSATLFHLQANGLTLNFLKEKALQEFDGSLPQHFLFQDGMYYRLLTDHLGRTNKQLIVPSECRSHIINKGQDNMINQSINQSIFINSNLKYTKTMRDYLSKARTTDRILRHFWCSNSYKNIVSYIKSCTACQMTTRRKLKEKVS